MNGYGLVPSGIKRSASAQTTVSSRSPSPTSCTACSGCLESCREKKLFRRTRPVIRRTALMSCVTRCSAEPTSLSSHRMSSRATFRRRDSLLTTNVWIGGPCTRRCGIIGWNGRVRGHGIPNLFCDWKAGRRLSKRTRCTIDYTYGEYKARNRMTKLVLQT